MSLLADNLHKKFKGTKLTNIEILAERYKNIVHLKIIIN